MGKFGQLYDEKMSFLRTLYLFNYLKIPNQTKTGIKKFEQKLKQEKNYTENKNKKKEKTKKKNKNITQRKKLIKRPAMSLI